MANTVIGTSIIIDGEISGDEELVIQGTVKGKIALQENLHVENGGVVEADIETQTITISGQVTGNIRLTKTLRVEAGGIVVADVNVKDCVVAGVVVGDVTASDSVHINDGGRMVGDINAPRVIIVAGASFRGRVDMGDMESE